EAGAVDELLDRMALFRLHARAPSGGDANRPALVLPARVVCRPAHTLRPFCVVVPHPDLVVNRAVLLTALEHPTAAAVLAHRTALAMHGEQVLVQIASERSPDHVVIEHALRALLRCVPLESQPAKLDDHLVRAQRD